MFFEQDTYYKQLQTHILNTNSNNNSYITKLRSQT